MPTKTFSSRVDAADLAFAETVTRSQFGMSFGQYCGSVLIEAIKEGVELPARDNAASKARADAIAGIKSIADLPHDPEIAQMSDQQIKSLITGRYA